MKNNKNCFKRAKMGEHTFFATFLFFSPREHKNVRSRKTFLDPERLFETSGKERKERRVVESGARGCGVRSEGRGPLWGGRAEDVTAPRGRRSDPKRL